MYVIIPLLMETEVVSRWGFFSILNNLTIHILAELLAKWCAHF